MEITLTPEARAFLRKAAINQKRREEKRCQQDRQEALEARQLETSSVTIKGQDMHDMQYSTLTNAVAKQDT